MSDSGRKIFSLFKESVNDKNSRSEKLEDDNREYCKDCTDKQHLFNQAVSVYEYSEGIKQSIYNFKYHNKRENSRKNPSSYLHA